MIVTPKDVRRSFEARRFITQARFEAMQQNPEKYTDEDRAHMEDPVTKALLAGDRDEWERLRRLAGDDQ